MLLVYSVGLFVASLFATVAAQGRVCTSYITSGRDPKNQFQNPPPSCNPGNYAGINVYTVGTAMTISWLCTTNPVTLAIVQENAASPRLFLATNYTSNTYTWNGFPPQPLTNGITFFFELFESQSSNSALFASDYINITSVNSGSTSSTASSSSSSSTSSASRAGTTSTSLASVATASSGSSAGPSATGTAASTATASSSSAPVAKTTNGEAIGIGVGVGVGVCLLIGAIIGFFCLRRRKQKAPEPSPTGGDKFYVPNNQGYNASGYSDSPGTSYYGSQPKKPYAAPEEVPGDSTFPNRYNSPPPRFQGGQWQPQHELP